MKLGKTNVHYRIWESLGDTIENHILLLHGFAGSTFSFDSLAPHLQKSNCKMVAFDFPAFGYSDKSENADYSDSFKLSIALTLMNKINPKISWIVLGHSMGATTAAALSRYYPSKVKKLILLDGVPFSSSENKVLSLFLNFSPTKRLAEFIANYFLFNEEKFTDLLASAYEAQPSSDQVKAYLKPFFIPRSATAILEMASLKQSIVMSETKLNEISKLIIWGEKDNWVNIQAAKDFMHKVKNTQLKIIPGAGHCPMETHAYETASQIITFSRNEN